MYKEAYVMLKEAGWWDDTKQFAKGAWNDIKKSYNQNKDTWRPWIGAGAAFLGTGLLSSFIKNPTLRFALPWLVGAAGWYGGHMYNQYDRKKKSDQAYRRIVQPQIANAVLSPGFNQNPRFQNGQFKLNDRTFTDKDQQFKYGLLDPDYWRRKAQRQRPKYGPLIQNLPKQ